MKLKIIKLIFISFLIVYSSISTAITNPIKNYHIIHICFIGAKYFFVNLNNVVILVPYTVHGEDGYCDEDEDDE